MITADVTVDPAYTAGTLAALINFIPKVAPGLSVAGGLFNSGPPPAVNVAIETVLAGYQVAVNATLKLRYTSPDDTAALYNLLGAIPTPTCSGAYANSCRYAVMLGTSEATLNLANAYRAQIESVTTGKTPGGYIPFQPTAGSTDAKPTWTNQILAFLQNPLRPNGGLASRFPDISQALGINPAMPAGGKYLSEDKRTVLNTTTVDATWAYDPIGDFPEVFNLTAIGNSLAAYLPLNLVDGLEEYVITDDKGVIVSTTDIGLNIAGILQVAVPGTPIGTYTVPMADGKSYYATLVPKSLPFLTPLRLPGLGINALLSAINSPYLLGNPVADALEPALKILVNIAYPDVISPTKLNECATGCQEGGTPKTWAELGYTAYQRTFLNSGVPTPFGSVQPLTPEEKKAVPGDVWNAFVDGVKEQLAKPFWGILVPNGGGAQSGAATPASAVKAAASTPEPVAPPAVTPQVSSPAAPVDEPSVPAVQVSAPVADPVPAVDLSGLADVPAPAPAPRAGTHRSAAATSSSDNNDAPQTSSALTGRHRGAA